MSAPHSTCSVQVVEFVYTFLCAYLASLPCATLDMNAVSLTPNTLWQLLAQDLISQSFASC